MADDPADRRALRRAARDALVASPSPAASVAYAIGELSRQLGDRALARTWLGRAAGAAGTPAHLRGWAVAALARLGR